MSEAEIIAAARSFDPTVDSPLAALEAFYMNGFQDSQTGDAEHLAGHVYRVERWLVWTDNQGFHRVESFATPDEAEAEVERYADECAAEEVF